MKELSDTFCLSYYHYYKKNLNSGGRDQILCLYHLYEAECKLRGLLAMSADNTAVEFMNDEHALLLGYTKRVFASSMFHEFAMLVKPDADFDGHFMGFDTDNQEWLSVNGWNFHIEEL